MAVRQRTLWIAFFGVVVTSTIVVDAIELRVNSEQSYWRDEWGEVGGAPEWIAMAAWFGGPLVAGALVCLSIILAGSRWLPRSRWRFAVYSLALPVGLLVAFGIWVAIRIHPFVFYSDRTS